MMQNQYHFLLTDILLVEIFELPNKKLIKLPKEKYSKKYKSRIKNINNINNVDDKINII